MKFRSPNFRKIEIKNRFTKIRKSRPCFKCTNKKIIKEKIFEIEKVCKEQNKNSIDFTGCLHPTNSAHYDNFISSNFLELRKNKIEQEMEKIKRKIENLVSKQTAIDLRDIKIYHKLSLEYKHNFYLTPLTSNINSGYLDSHEPEDKSSHSPKEKETKSFIPPGLRIISPNIKEYFCNCKRNECRKNYCDCRRNKEMCDPRTCYCQDCFNQC